MRSSTTAKKSSSKNQSAGKKSSARSGNSRQKSSSGRSRTSKSASSNGEESNEEQQSLLDVLFLDMLKDMYSAEKMLVDALQKMNEAATTDELQEAFEDHQFVTQKHVSRLEKVFAMLGEEPQEETCEAMAALIKEGEKVISKTKEGSMTRDAGLIIAAQKVEHYEIAAYGSLVQVALTLGNDEAAYILERTLNEEEDTDSLLTEIAETEINPMADDEPSTEGEMEGMGVEMELETETEEL
ncbi:MAG: ferritin-like domain-containing protein [Flavipsychrobacter sp.]